MASFKEEINPDNPDVPLPLDRWIPAEGDSTDPLQDRLYKLQYHMFLCDQKFEKWKTFLQRHFEKEQEDILKKFGEKIKELDAPPSPPLNKAKANSSVDEFSKRGV
ncbi:hypothetical protein MA16_Dca019449 [Dendrobium catenatum]|uniref:Uncharacterized protein n=1 Tax=Dendrobium catenatum TaxID=906689 RepID=A0A2I0WHD8_9ASPA|nr:hypothetical protein MA16_Dca019449 [Dendrobium catenatum]